MLGDSRNINCSANPCVRRSAAYGCAVRKTRVLAILTFAAIAVSSSQVSAKSSPTEFGCLQRLPTGRKDLPPVHVCGSATELEEGLQTQSLTDTLEGTSYNWIILWQKGALANVSTATACLEAESLTEGRFNGTCTAIFTSVFQGFSAWFTKSQLLRFVAAYKDSIESVHQDGGVTATNIQYNAPWALDRLDQEFLPLDGQYSYFSTGSNVNVYIIDTGIRTSHDEFQYMDGSPGSRAQEVYSSLTSGTAGQDCNGHGTAVAASVGGLTYGPAKNVTLLAVRSLECLGNGTVTQVIQGLEWVKDNYVPPAVVVMALGGDSQYTLDLAVAEVVQAGVPVMVAAGNEDTDACLTSPAREPLAITVSATDQNDSRLWVSAGTGANYGTCVDIWAPGSSILSASNTADNATEYRSGTSQAVPFVAGAAAIYLQNNTGASPLELNTALMSSGSWGVIHEPSASGVLNADVLADTVNVLANTAMFHAVNLEPQSIQITGGADGFGPFLVNVTLAQAPLANVSMAVSLSNASRATVTPQQLLFTPNNWSLPQLLNLSTAAEAYQSVDSDDFYVQLNLTSNDTNFNNTHPRLQVTDSKGDTVAYPKAILSLPFTDQGNTYFFTDNYDYVCGSENSTASGGSKDVAYFFQPEENCTVTVSTCNSAQFVDDFDTVLYVLGNATGPGLMEIVSCNDDACSYLSQLQVSMTAGSPYAIIVDGYGGKFGQYQITVTAAQGSINGTAPPLDLSSVNVPINDLVPSGPTVSPEVSPTEEAPSAGCEESPPTVTVPDISTAASAPTASDASESDPPVPSNASPAFYSTSPSPSSPLPSPPLSPLPASLSSPSPASLASPSPALPSPSSPVTASAPTTSPSPSFSSSPLSPTPTYHSPSPVLLQTPSPEQTPPAAALSAQMSPSPSPAGPSPPSLTSLTAQTGLSPSAEAAVAPASAATSPASVSPASSPVSNPSPLVNATNTSTTITPPTLSPPISSPEPGSPEPYSVPFPASLNQSLQQTLALLPSASASPAPATAETPALPPAPSSNPSYNSYTSANAPGPETTPASASATPYGMVPPVYATFPPTPGPFPAPGPMPAPAPAPEAAVAPAAAAGAEAAPALSTKQRMLLPSHTLSPEPSSTTPSAAAVAAEPGGPIASAALTGGSDAAGATVERDDASVSPAGGKGGSGLGPKDIGIMAGAIGAGIVMLGVGLYAHMASRRRQQSGTKGAASVKESEAEAGQVASKSVSSQPSLAIAQSKQPMGGLFEPIGCPQLGTPHRHEPHSLIQSIASSTKSRSKLSCSLRPYPTTAAAAPVAVNVQANSFDSRSRKQQTLPGQLPCLTLQSNSWRSAEYSMTAAPFSGATHSQHAQDALSSLQHAQQAADDTLSQEAAAAEAVLDSFSRLSSAEALHSHIISESATMVTQPAVGQATAASQEAASQQETATDAAVQSAAQQQLTGLSNSCSQQQPDVQGYMSKGGVGAGSSKPQQGYPGQQAGRLFGRTTKGLTEAQAKALTSLEVARQRQSNRAQLHLLQPGGQMPQASGPFQKPRLLSPEESQEDLQEARLPEKPSGALPGTGQAHQAKAKLEAIRKELGILEQARESMLHHQPGAVANHFRGSQAQPLPRASSSVPGTAVRVAGQAPMAQTSAPPPKHAKHVGSKLPPSSAGASANSRGVSASNRAAGGTASSAGSSQAAASLGMTWNPVRLMSPFEKTKDMAAGGINNQAASRSGWSLHSITFSAADAAAKESRQLTLSQMTWSLEHSRSKET